eukprot:TRINITY_DN95781_c0_g1_i1.p1 TRINITY_DN95781_c0_g1~~TRINITY_DN95781_c0_g1_i1.p1  ORF type:complete len:101 (+),score=9.14 TRINITY_DN95781_c0_g1_i1:81-383(+)
MNRILPAPPSCQGGVLASLKAVCLLCGSAAIQPGSLSFHYRISSFSVHQHFVAPNLMCLRDGRLVDRQDLFRVEGAQHDAATKSQQSQKHGCQVQGLQAS